MAGLYYTWENDMHAVIMRDLHDKKASQEDIDCEILRHKTAMERWKQYYAEKAKRVKESNELDV